MKWKGCMMVMMVQGGKDRRKRREGEGRANGEM